MSIKSGVYAIENSINGHCYIGSTNNLPRRESQHNRALRSEKHHSFHLQRAYLKYGAESFKFRVLLYCEPFELLRYEQSLIDRLHPAYNVSPTASSQLGVRRSRETRQKISEARKGKKMPPRSEEHRQKISAANRARFATLEVRKIAREKQLGKSHVLSENTLEKIKAANRARVWDKDARKQMSETTLGHLVSDESRKKNSETHKGMTHSEETRKKMSESRSGKRGGM